MAEGCACDIFNLPRQQSKFAKLSSTWLFGIMSEYTDQPVNPTFPSARLLRVTPRSEPCFLELIGPRAIEAWHPSVGHGETMVLLRWVRFWWCENWINIGSYYPWNHLLQNPLWFSYSFSGDRQSHSTRSRLPRFQNTKWWVPRVARIICYYDYYRHCIIMGLIKD